MKTDVQKVSACRVKMTVEATAEEIDPIYKSVRSAYIAQAKLPGFRPGKAPWAQIEKLYGKDIQENTNQRVLQKLMEASQEAKLKVVNVVNIENVKSAMGEGASATFTLDLHPEFKTPDTKKWQIKKIDDAVAQEAIDAQLADVRNMAASFREATADDVATEEDLLAISFTSDLDKEALSDAAKHYASDDEYWVQIREDAFIPGLKEALTGKKLNDTVTFAATYPADYRVADIAGKTVNYTVTLKSMRTRTPADDATVLARFGMKDMEELTEAITKHLKATKTQAEETRAAKELSDLIDASVKFDLPEQSLEMHTYDELARDASKPLETFKDDLDGLKKSDAYKTAKEKAAADLRRLYVLGQIAQERDVKLSKEAFDAALENLAQNTGLKKNEVINRLQQNDRMDEFLARELAGKMLGELVKECATL